MDLQVERKGRSLAKVRLSVSREDFEKEVRQGLQRARGSVRMKGFRPGKAPMPVVEKHYGDRVRMEVREVFLRQAFQRAVEQEGLRPISSPRVDLVGLAEEAQGGGFETEFEISLKPEIELGGYEGMRIESELEPVLDQEVEEAIADVRRQRSRPEPSGEEGLDAEGMMLCDLAFLHGEREVWSREGLNFFVGSPPPGIDPEAFAQALRGAKDGDEVRISMTLPALLEDEEARGQEGACRVRVQQAFRMVPPPEEELHGIFEVSSDADLRRVVRERIAEAKQEREEARIESALLERLIAATEIEVPEPLLEDQTRARLEQLHRRLEEQGLDHEGIHHEMDEQRGTAREEAEKGLKALLLVEALGEKEGLLVTREELQAALEEIARRNEASVEEVREYYSRNNMGQQMAIELLERKVRRFLREKAEIVQPS